MAVGVILRTVVDKWVLGRSSIRDLGRWSESKVLACDLRKALGKVCSKSDRPNVATWDRLENNHWVKNFKNRRVSTLSTMGEGLHKLCTALLERELGKVIGLNSDGLRSQLEKNLVV